MTLGTARMINKLSKIFLAAALSGLLFFLVIYFKGGIAFKYFSLPVMACFIGITWIATSKAAVTALEEENKKEDSSRCL